jgi:hypothetical protein
VLDAPASLSSGHESFSESALPCRANLKPVILLNAIQPGLDAPSLTVLWPMSPFPESPVPCRTDTDPVIFQCSGWAGSG